MRLYVCILLTVIVHFLPDVHDDGITSVLYEVKLEDVDSIILCTGKHNIFFFCLTQVMIILMYLCMYNTCIYYTLE